MTNAERALALLEATTHEDVARLCGADRLTALRQLERWRCLLETTRPRMPKAGVLADLKTGDRSL